MRCAYCHDDLDLEHHRCDGCGTLLHLDCSSSNSVCPTLGCNHAGREAPPIPIHVRPIPGRPTAGRLATWLLLGVLLPLVAFGIDATLHVDPLIWGTAFLDQLGTISLGPKPLPWAHFALVWGATSLSMLGLVLFALRRTRASLPFLSLGVAVSGAHALAFVALLPFSLIAVFFGGLGLLGLLPFATFWVFLDAAKRARALLREDETSSQGVLVNEDSRLKRRLLLFVGALVFAGASLLIPRPEIFHSPGAWDLQSVDLVSARSEALELLHAETPALRNKATDKLMLRFETYRESTIPSYPSIVTQGRQGVSFEWEGFEQLDEPSSSLDAPPPNQSHTLWIMENEDALPPTPPGTRSVEFAPGVWSQWQHTPAEEGHEAELQRLPLW